LGPDPAAVRFNQALGDRQPEPRSAAAAGAVGAPEPLEHPRGCFRRQSLAAVLDTEEQVGGAPLDPHRNRAVGGGVAQRVGHEVEENALELVGRELGLDCGIHVGAQGDAIGARRSWLAQATSSRRASKSCSSPAAIALNESASSAISRAPPTGARVESSPAARDWEAAPTRRSDAVIARARTSAATTAAVADPAATARIFTSAPMWNITQPDSSTAASGTQTAIKASP